MSQGNAEGRICTIPTTRGMRLAQVDGGKEIALLHNCNRANAQRLADCWNACEHIPAEVLHSGRRLYSAEQISQESAASRKHVKLMADYAALRDSLQASEAANEALKRDLGVVYVAYEALVSARPVVWYKPWTWRAWRGD